jgi:hypothetical protein
MFYQSKLAVKNTADVTGGKPIAVLLQSISGVSAINPLIAFYDIHGGKREVLFFYLVPEPHETYESFIFIVVLRTRKRLTPKDVQRSRVNRLMMRTKCKVKRIGQIMGGQLEFGGIWVSAVFGEGSCAESCSTFRGYRRLSRDANFRVKSLELWGVGERPMPDRDEVSHFFTHCSNSCECGGINRLMMMI